MICQLWITRTRLRPALLLATTDVNIAQVYIKSLYLYFTTTSYTVIAVLYLGVGVVSLTIRSELNVLGFYQTGAGSYDVYNSIITSHGIGMIFLFIMPSVISFVGN